jgi:uncharacterized membrane protein (DUF485 family)
MSKRQVMADLLHKQSVFPLQVCAERTGMNSKEFAGQSVAGGGVKPTRQAAGTVWDRVAGSKPFEKLIKAKKWCIIPMFLFFAAYYLLLPLLMAYAPQLLAVKVGGMSVAYLFGLSLIFLAWAIVWLYVKVAARFDVMAKNIVADAQRPEGGV